MSINFDAQRQIDVYGIERWSDYSNENANQSNPLYQGA